MSVVTSGNFTFSDVSLAGVKLVDIRSFPDSRGSFMETYKRSDFEAGGIDCQFVQDNQSVSRKGVLRGLHFQIKHPQAKLMRVVVGAIFDVAVDLRPQSPTYGKWEGVTLSADNQCQLFIPRGFAHGFLALSDVAVVFYKCDDVYHPGDEGGIAWNDPQLAVIWPALEGDDVFDASKLILSEKDAHHPTLAQLTEEGRLP